MVRDPRAVGLAGLVAGLELAVFYLTGYVTDPDNFIPTAPSLLGGLLLVAVALPVAYQWAACRLSLRCQPSGRVRTPA